jgi:hypothetical protein
VINFLPDRVDIADRFYNAGTVTLINAVRELLARPDDLDHRHDHKITFFFGGRSDEHRPGFVR